MDQGTDRASRRPTPLHRQLTARIQQEIVHRALPPHGKLASEVALARQYGVSRGTITKAVDTLVREGVLYRRQPQGTFVSPGAPTGITEGAGAGAMRPPAPASSVVGLVVPQLPESFVGHILLGVETVTRAAGYGLIFAHSEHDAGLERYHVEQFVHRAAAGILLFPVAPAAERQESHREADDEWPALRALRRRRTPFVLIDRYMPGVDCDYVVSDDSGAGYAATQHLTALGHRRIGFLADAPCVTSTANRYAGYLQCLREQGLPIEEALIPHLQGRTAPARPSDEPDGPATPVVTADRTLLRAYLGQAERASAVVAANEYVGLRALQAAEDLGLDVPGELSIVCCGPGDVGAHARVPLTSIVQPAAEVGRHAAHILLDRIAGRSSVVRHVTLPVSLVVRQSCGAGPRAVTHVVASTLVGGQGR